MEIQLLIDRVQASKLPQQTKDYIVSCIEVAYSLGKQDALKIVIEKTEQLTNNL